MRHLYCEFWVDMPTLWGFNPMLRKSIVFLHIHRNPSPFELKLPASRQHNYLLCVSTSQWIEWGFSESETWVNLAARSVFNLVEFFCWMQWDVWTVSYVLLTEIVATSSLFLSAFYWTFLYNPKVSLPCLSCKTSVKDNLKKMMSVNRRYLIDATPLRQFLPPITVPCLMFVFGPINLSVYLQIFWIGPTATSSLLTRFWDLERIH